jgi:hypothetical protein
LDEEDRAEKNHDPCDEQEKAKARPAFPGRIGENEGRDGMWRVLFHLANVSMSRGKM